MYGKFQNQGQITGNGKVNKALHDNPFLQSVVEDFSKVVKKKLTMYEPLVADDKRMLCGQIDRLLIVDEKKRFVGFKTTRRILMLTKEVLTVN